MTDKPTMEQREKLAEWLLDKIGDLSYRELARRTGLSNATIVYIAQAKAENPTAETLGKLADYFKVPRAAVYGMVGMLPPEKREDAITNEILHDVDNLPPDLQKTVATMIRAIREQHESGQRKKNTVQVEQIS